MIPPILGLLLSLAGSGERLLPQVPLSDFTGTEARALDDYLGQVVLVDFFAHWCAPCARLVPHLDELAQAFGPQGLNVLGVTGDDAATAKDWLTRQGAHYPHARDPELALQIELGYRPLPSAVLVDPCGVIVWQGNPADAPVERIEELLEGALPEPACRWPASAAPVREALRGARFAEAARLARALSERGPEIARLVERIIARRVELLESALAEQDFLSAEERAAELEAGLDDGPARSRAKAVRAEIASSPDARAVLDLQRQLHALWKDVKSVASAKEADQLAERIRAVAASKSGTQVERSADAYLATLAALKSILP